MQRRKLAMLTGLTVAVLLVLVVFVASCGGGEETTTTAASTSSTGELTSTTTSGAAPTGEPIKVGAPTPLTGAYAADGQHIQMGNKMAVADINAAGGLLGRPVELVEYDIQELLPETIAASKNYLIDKEKVDFVVEAYGGYGPDFQAYGAESDVPFLHGSGSVRAADMVKADPVTYANMFQGMPIEADWGRRAWQGIIQFEDAYQYPNRKIALVHGDLEWDLNYTAAVAEEAQKAGWEVVMNETIPYGTSDWGSVLSQIRADAPAAVVCSMISVPDISSFVKQFMENPPQSILDISYMVVFKEVQEAVGNPLTGVMGYVTSYLPPSPENDAWKARFKEMFGMDVPLTTPPSQYDMIMMWAEAVKKVGDPTKYTEICDAIRTTKYDGLIGIYDLNNPEQTNKVGADFQIAYSQYSGDGKLAFSGVDPFIFPPWIQPAWPAK